jgi:DNA-binding NarL/FixJ family response regulator
MLEVRLSLVEELVLRGTTYGLTCDEIAAGLRLSRQSVGRQIAEAYSKMHQLARIQSNVRSQDSSCVLLSVAER